MSMYLYKKFCGRCSIWLDKENLRCPDCNRKLRTKPKFKSQKRTRHYIICRMCKIRVNYTHGYVGKFCPTCRIVHYKNKQREYERQKYGFKRRIVRFSDSKFYSALKNEGVYLHDYAKYGYKTKKCLECILSRHKKKGLEIEKTEITMYKIKPKSDTNEKSEMTNIDTAT